MEITPTEETAHLRLRRGRDRKQIGNVARRWLQRLARRQGRYINEPSFAICLYYDPFQSYHSVVATAYSLPDTLPDWLRTACPVNEGVIHLSDIKDVMSPH